MTGYDLRVSPDVRACRHVVLNGEKAPALDSLLGFSNIAAQTARRSMWMSGKRCILAFAVSPSSIRDR